LAERSIVDRCLGLGRCLSSTCDSDRPIPAALGAIDELAALLLRVAQIGEQLPHRVIGQHRMQALKAS
jgi:hypothetical protein